MNAQRSRRIRSKRRSNVDQEIDFSWGVKIPMRDGIELNATLYKPKGEAKVPVVFTLTPYVADTYHERSVFFARNGYAFALVDCRGRGNSTGDFEPFANEGRDGYDVVEWLARQPWSNGSVTMWGGSYAGFDQWSTLKELPPHLKTIVPVASAYPGYDFPFIRNIWYPYMIQWLTLTSGKPANNALFNDTAFWIEKYREHYIDMRPFRELDKTVGNSSTIFQEWFKHPVPDAYWNAMVPSPKQYPKIKVPILTITGQYDGDQQGALEYYNRHMKYGSSWAKEHHYLIMGPWDHPGTRTPKREIGGITFGEASLVDLNKLHKEWYDWTMKNGKKPAFLKKRVAYYVTGTEKWKYADSLREISRRKQALYLSVSARPLGAFSTGIIQPQKPIKLPSDEYVYDPLDTSQADLERDEVKNFITDQRYAINLSGDGLVYHSKPFAEEIEISGFIRLVAWIAMDAPDTDFWVRLYEIKHDGTSIFLTEDWMRARYRESSTTARLVEPGKIERYEFNKFYFFARAIAKRSVLRLVIRPPNSIYWQKTYNSGGEVSEESAADARTAHVKIFHDPEHTSFLEVPTTRPAKFA